VRAQSSSFASRSTNREPETKSLCPVALRGLQLKELMEDLALLLQRDASARIPHLDAKRVPATTTHDDAAPIRVANGIGNKISQDTLQEERIGARNRRAPAPNQPQTLGLGLGEVVATNTLQHRLDRKVFNLRLNDAGVEAGDVEAGGA
jgi:hypothetical protein